MVATLAKAASADYYIQSQASYRPAHLYYTAGEEPDGVWWNPSGLFTETLHGMGHGSRVDSAHFYKVYNGFDPATGARLTQNAGSEKRCPAYDLTFNADKTVSALWAISPPDIRTRIEAAHNDAVRVALEDAVARHCSYTRIRDARKTIRIVSADILAALFQHGASRSNDPHLHTHCVIMNAAQAHHDRVWRALHGGPLYCWQKAAGAVYRAELAWLLRDRLGIELEPHGKREAFTRIAGIPEDLVKEWSRRNVHITDTAARMGVVLQGNGALREAVQRFTRDTKEQGIDPEERFLGWLERARRFVEDIGAFVQSVIGTAGEIRPEQVREVTRNLDDLPARMTHHDAVFRYTDIVEQAANAGIGLLSREARNTAVARVVRSPDLVRLDKPAPSPDAAIDLAHTRSYTSADNMQAEKDIHALATELVEAGEFGIPEDAVRGKIEALAKQGYPLSDEQVDAIAFAASPGRIAIIEGAAGSGKTTTLRPLADLYREQGCKVIATAVPWIVSEALGNDLAAPNYSVAKLISVIEHGHVGVDSDTVIVVDEAGMLSSQQARRILRLGREHGAKIVFAGDTEQQQPVTAGPGLRLVRDVAGSIRVDRMRRQKPDAEDVLVALTGARRETARLHVSMASDKENQRIVDEFEALPDREKPDIVPWQVEASEAFRNVHADRAEQAGHTAGAIEAYASRGRFHIERDLERTLTRLVDHWQRFRDEHPEKTHAVIAQSNAEVSALSHLMRERSVATGEAPPVTVQACRGRDPAARPTPLEIALGDRIRIGALHWRKRLFNGTVVTVEALHEAKSAEDGTVRAWIRGRTDRGREVSFWHDEIRSFHGKVRLDYGYALTMASAQGMTVDRAFVLANQKPARETIYPAATRHRERLDFYVDRKPLEFEIREHRPEDEAGAPVTDEDVKAWLARRWSRLQPKEAAKDYMSERMQAEVYSGSAERLSPAHADGARWLATNDNGSGALAAAASRMRDRDLAAREGAAAAGLGDAYRRLAPALESWERTAGAEGNAAVALDPRFEADFRESLDAVAAARPFLGGSARRERLLAERGGIAAADLLELADKQRAARAIHAARNGGSAAPGTETRTAPRAKPNADPDALLDALRADLSDLVPDTSPPVGHSPESGVAVDIQGPRRDMPAPGLEDDPGLLASRERDLARGPDSIRNGTGVAVPQLISGTAAPPPPPSAAPTDPVASVPDARMREAARSPGPAEAEALYRKFLSDARENAALARRRGIHPYETGRAPALVDRTRGLLAHPSLRPEAARVLRDALAAYDRWQADRRGLRQGRPPATQPSGADTAAHSGPRAADASKPAPSRRAERAPQPPAPRRDAPGRPGPEPAPATPDPETRARELLESFGVGVSRRAAEAKAEEVRKAEAAANETPPATDELVRRFLREHADNEDRARSASAGPYRAEAWPRLYRTLSDLLQRSDLSAADREALARIFRDYREWRRERSMARMQGSRRQSHRIRR